MSLTFTDEQRAENKKKAKDIHEAYEAEFLRTAKVAVVKLYQGIPARYKRGWLRTHLGYASKRQAIASMCYSCAKYRDVQKAVGGCQVTLCPLFKYRPLQRGKVK